MHKNKMLYFAICYTQDANEERPHQLLIRELSKVSKEDAKEFALKYFMAVSLIALEQKKEVKKFSLPKDFTLLSATKFYCQLIDFNGEIVPTDKTVFDFSIVKDNIDYFSTSTDWEE